MKYQKQAFRHKPEEGQYGDCHRTAIACLLDMPRDSVPNFGEHYGSVEKFYKAEREFLESVGLAKVSVVYQGTLDQVLTTMGAVNPGAYYILGGTSKSGFGHSVIGRGGKIVWDPHPDEVGIVGPMDDGYYWVTYFVPGSLVEEVGA